MRQELLDATNGIEVLSLVGKRDGTIFRILSTAGFNIDCMSEALGCGAAQAVLEKPFSKKSLARLFRAIELGEVNIVIKYES